MYIKNQLIFLMKLQIICKWFNDNLNKEFIRKSCFCFVILFFLVAKPENNIQIHQDYWELNNIIIKNYYSLLLIKKTLDTSYYTKIYTKLDIIAAFNKLHIAERYEWKMAFTIRFGLFEFLVMFFGLYNILVLF